MEKLITTTSQITTTITSNTTGKNTYAIERIKTAPNNAEIIVTAVLKVKSS